MSPKCIISWPTPAPPYHILCTNLSLPHPCGCGTYPNPKLLIPTGQGLHRDPTLRPCMYPDKPCRQRLEPQIIRPWQNTCDSPKTQDDRRLLSCGYKAIPQWPAHHPWTMSQCLIASQVLMRYGAFCPVNLRTELQTLQPLCFNKDLAPQQRAVPHLHCHHPAPFVSISFLCEG